MKSQKRLSQKIEEREMIRQPGFNLEIYFGEKASKRFKKAEQSNKFREILCGECRHLIKLSKFDGKRIYVSVPDNEQEDELYWWNFQKYIVGLKEEDEKAGRPLKGQLSLWKRKACKGIYEEHNKKTAKQIDRWVGKADAYTSKERLEIGTQEALEAYYSLEEKTDKTYNDEKTQNKCSNQVFEDLVSWKSAHKSKLMGEDRNGKLYRCKKCGDEWLESS